MNKVYLIGRLTNAPEQRQTPNGVSVCTFSIAVNRRMNREVTDYFNVVAWRGLAETCAKYLVKGQRVAVCGELQTRSYDDKNGVKRYVTEVACDDVEFLDRPAAGEGDKYPAKTQKPAENGANGFAQAAGLDEMEISELPF